MPSPPDQFRWNPLPMPAEPTDCVDGLVAMAAQGEDYPDMEGERSPSGVVTAGGAKAAWFKDTEGNTLAVIQDA